MGVPHRAPRRRTVALGVAAVLLAACAGASAGAGGGPPTPPGAPGVDDVAPGGFRVTVSTDRDRYAADEEVSFTVQTCNLGAATTTEEGGPPFGFAVLDGDDLVVADSSHTVSTMELRLVRWAAGECRQDTDRWDQHRWNRPEDAPTEPPEVWGTPQRGERVPPGPYRVKVSSPYGGATSQPFTLDD